MLAIARQRVTVVLLLLGFVLGPVAVAYASAPSGHEAVAEEADQRGPEPDHWSFFTALIPGKSVHDARSWIGKSAMGDDVGKVMHVPAALFAALITLLLGLIAGRWFRNTERSIKPPSRFSVAAVMELVLQGIYNLSASMMSEKWAKKTFPILATTALFIFVCNNMGSIPGLFPPTDNLNTTMAMALVIFVTTHYCGIQAHGVSYFKHFLGPITHPAALPLMLLMVVIETIGHLARVLSLSIRLMGNMFADHTVLGIFLGLIPLVIPIPIQVLGLLVALVQTFVFLILSVVYISMAVEDHADEH
ncbi:MAG TPA: F0F1 ATP synthase subunit A [Myxococcales bacterium]|nr:F0F1 ATP synthase subunit A [Myxococcales bacterium]